MGTAKPTAMWLIQPVHSTPPHHLDVQRVVQLPVAQHHAGRSAACGCQVTARPLICVLGHKGAQPGTGQAQQRGSVLHESPAARRPLQACKSMQQRLEQCVGRSLPLPRCGTGSHGPYALHAPSHLLRRLSGASTRERGRCQAARGWSLDVTWRAEWRTLQSAAGVTDELSAIPADS